MEQRKPMLLFAAARFFRIVLLRAQGVAAPDKKFIVFLGSIAAPRAEPIFARPVGADASVKISILDR